MDLITERDLNNIAMMCHAVNRAYCEFNGDTSQVPWSQAPQWQRDSAIAGAKGICNGTITRPEESHESWLAVKNADGWSYGEVKDVDKKEHPCMVPYDQLPPEQRVKDHLFFAVVSSYLARNE